MRFASQFGEDSYSLATKPRRTMMANGSQPSAIVNVSVLYSFSKERMRIELGDRDEPRKRFDEGRTRKRRRTMNVKLLRKVKRHILEEPKRFVMSTVNTHGEPGTPTGLGGMFPRCGSAACICGWVCSLSGKPWSNAYYETARKLLGIPLSTAEKLFDPGSWPSEFEGGLTDDGKLKTAKVAAARIEHFIKTDGRE